MPQEQTLECFKALLEETFQLRLDPSSTAELVLVEVTALSVREPEEFRRDRGLRKSPFSLLFRGPEEPLLSQGTYSVGHSALGSCDLFLVPVGRDSAGFLYEAVFN